MVPDRSPEQRVPIRNGALRDVDALLALDSVARMDAQRRTQIRKWISEGQTLVAHHDGRIVGYGVVEHSFFGRAFIAMLYVDPSERRRGLGTRIVEHLEQRAESPRVFTSTNQSNVPMQRLLERIGYERSGSIENLDPGAPELVYSKPKVIRSE
ncbi:MAG: GNAT family N-acetyltransferase [Myxococcota bacterium]